MLIVLTPALALMFPYADMLTAPKQQLRDSLLISRSVVSMSRGAVKEPGLLVKTVQAARKKRRDVDAAPLTYNNLIPPGVERTITFTGCGGLYTYLFGVASYVQQNFDVADSTVFASASAGAYPAFLLAAGIDVESFHRKENKAFLAAVEEERKSRSRDSRVAPLGIWNGVLEREWRSALLGRLDAAQIEHMLVNKHYISLTAMPTLENRLVGEFSSLDDLVSGFIASGFLPIYDSERRLATEWRGERFFDGGLSDNAPVPFQGVPSLVLSPSKWRAHTELERVPVPFVRSDWAWNDAKFKLGQEDAREHHEELRAFFLQR